ncbi:Uncharacterised protein [Providencia rustigianii]|nr:Uncharacterised protein [Providencia rustigianii]
MLRIMLINRLVMIIFGTGIYAHSQVNRMTHVVLLMDMGIEINLLRQ